MAKGKSASSLRFAPPMEGEVIPPDARRAQWSGAFKLAELNDAAQRGTDPRSRHSDGEVPWQLALADYEIRFSEKSRDSRKGFWGIYLRDYNVCVATLADNSYALRNALTRMFDAARVLSKGTGHVSRKTRRAKKAA